MDKPCPFCDRNQLGTERLIGSLGSLDIFATLGQISDGGYLLLIPRQHVPCLGAVPNVRELEQAIGRLRVVLAEEYRSFGVTMFEHGVVGQTVFHAHLHVIPENIAIGRRVRGDFPHHPIEEFADFRAFHFAYALEQRPYLLWRECGGRILVCWNPPALPGYLRGVVGEALQKPERVNWRTMDPVLDRELYLATVSRLKPYFAGGA